MSARAPARAAAAGRRPARPAAPRLGFAGVGWIGRNRLDAIARAGVAEIAAIAEPDDGLRADALATAPGARAAAEFTELLDLDLDGVVIATPSAMHARQALAALERGLAVFCQKPLGRDRQEAERVVAAARAADRLLGVDLAYRHTRAGEALKRAVASGQIGRLYALELTFHNAYGPDKAWFRSRALAGGGCLLDLGTHLVDLALWVAEPERVAVRSGRILREGRELESAGDEVEDFATAELELDGDVVARLACSWWLPAGRDCVLEALAIGTEGAVALRNVDGSFYDFRAELMRGTSDVTLAEPPDDWGGRAAVAWARRLRADPAFDPEVEHLVRLAGVLDAIYGAAS